VELREIILAAGARMQAGGRFRHFIFILNTTCRTLFEMAVFVYFFVLTKT
jgi:hypothetical protein